MKNIILVLKREYLTRVSKKSFIIMTFLTPLLMGLITVAPIWLATKEGDLKKVLVVDKNGLFENKFKSSKSLIFEYNKNGDFEKLKNNLKNGKTDVIVLIPEAILEDQSGLKIYAEKSVSLELKIKIENTVESEIENVKLLEAGLTQKVLESTKANVSSETISISEEGEKSSNSMAATGIGYLAAFAIYIAIFIYGSQVMRGVMEEKQSRIVEVIISSVKPFQLMMGKITGIALVGLTQFVLWITLTIAVSTGVKSFMGSSPQELQAQSVMNSDLDSKEVKEAKQKVMKKMKADNIIDETMEAINTLNIPLILCCFIIYFLGGYLLYASYFAAIGAAVDSDTEVQQFMMPVTIPLILAIVLAQFVLREPDGSIAFWGSIIPFTSPILMMVRLPFGVPTWQLILSIALLLISFVGMVLFAAKIYRVGILMYGKKVTFKEISKWIFYKS